MMAASSVFATQALGGPLRRLETIGKRLAAGDFPETIRIRHGDDLEEIAGSLNEALRKFHTTLTSVRGRSRAGREHLAGLQPKLAAGEVAASSVTAEFIQVAIHLDDLEETLRTYRL